MKLKDSYRINSDKQTIWEALNNPEILKTQRKIDQIIFFDVLEATPRIELG